MEKTKDVISGEEPMIRMESGRYPHRAVEEVWERIRYGMQDVNSGVIRDVHRESIGFCCPTCWRRPERGGSEASFNG